MSAITYLVIEPDGSIEVKTGVLGVKEAQAILASDIEMLDAPEGLRVTIIVGTEGKTRGDNPNWGITRLVRSQLRAGDFVTGRVIIAGITGPDGDPTSLTVKDEQAIRTTINSK
jgi:hypothetical protein